MPPTFRQVLTRLERRFGPVRAPVASPFEMILYEQVAYLVPEERRASAFAALVERIGSRADEILAAPLRVLVAICALGGMNAAVRADRIKRSAEIALECCDGDLTALARMSLPDARKIARSFDGFGKANAETLLLFAGIPVPALDSNGVRVLARLWFGSESQRYAFEHQRACASVASSGPYSAAVLIRGYLALQRHGRTICRRSVPDCAACPLRATCAYFRG